MTAAWLLCLAALTDEPPPAPVPTVAEVLAGYRKNLAAFPTLKVRIRREIKLLPALTDFQAELSKQMNDGTSETEPVAEPQKDVLTLLKARHDHLATYSNPSIYLGVAGYVNSGLFDETYFTNRIGFQLRSRFAPLNAPLDAESWTIPDSPTMDLAKLPPGSMDVVTSWDGTSAGGVRLWSSNASSYGQIYEMLPFAHDDYLVPLGAVTMRPNNPHQGWSSIDLFFQKPEQSYKVIGPTVRDGRNLVIVEEAVTPETINDSYGDYRSVVRALLDPARGWLPVQIEWLRKPVQESPSSPNVPVAQTLEVLEIAQIRGGGFYPMRGVIRKREPNPSRNPDPFQAKWEPVREETWGVLDVVSQPTMSVDFTLPFPLGTNYYDQRTGLNEMVGYEHINGYELPLRLCLGIALGWLGFGLAAGARWAYLRRRRRLRPHVVG